MELSEIVKRIVGNIKPIGESSEDAKRFDNLTVMCDLVVKLLDEIHVVAENKNRNEYSMKLAGIFADRFLSEAINPTTNFRTSENPPTEMDEHRVFEFEEGDFQATKECLMGVVVDNEPPVYEIGYYIPALKQWIDRDTFEIAEVVLWVYTDEIVK